MFQHDPNGELGRVKKVKSINNITESKKKSNKRVQIDGTFKNETVPRALIQPTQQISNLRGIKSHKKQEHAEELEEEGKGKERHENPIAKRAKTEHTMNGSFSQQRENIATATAIYPSTSTSNLNQFSTDLFEDLQTLLSSAFADITPPPPEQRVTNDTRIVDSSTSEDYKYHQHHQHHQHQHHQHHQQQHSLDFDLQIMDIIGKSKIFDESHKKLLNSPETHEDSNTTNSNNNNNKSSSNNTNTNNKSSSNNNNNSSSTHDSKTKITLPQDTSSLFAMSHQEENNMLKHFFKKLLPLLDGHPKSPWPDLALQYCDFDIARSCFISLACIHMYESKAGGSEYYQKGLAHINNTMDHLIRYIRENASRVNSPNNPMSNGLENDEDQSKKHVSYFVILVLMNVHILFAVVEKGKSSLARDFFKVFSEICKDPIFYNEVLTNNSKQRSLLVVLSWYDTVCAVVSPDYRLPYCLPQWYGTVSDSVSSSKMMGCPGEIFTAMSEVCTLRHQIRHDPMLTFEHIRASYLRIKQILLNYRDYVPLNTSGVGKEEDKEEENYVLRMNCALCWAIAVWITLNRSCSELPTRQSSLLLSPTTDKLVTEFISIYDRLDPKTAIVTQMVWPLYAIGCECKSVFERNRLLKYITALYEVTKMGTVLSMKEIVEKVWHSRLSQEECLSEWLAEGVDYLPL